MAKVYIVCFRKEMEYHYWDENEITTNIVGVTTTKDGAMQLVFKFIAREVNRFEDWYGRSPDWWRIPTEKYLSYEKCTRTCGAKYIDDKHEENEEIRYEVRFVTIREFITAD